MPAISTKMSLPQAQQWLKKRHYKKTSYDPIDYESIDHVDFWVIEDEEAPPELDIDEIGNVLYHDSAIPILGGSSRNNEGDEELDTTAFQFQNGDSGPNSEDGIPLPNIFDCEGINLDEYYDN